MSIINIGPLAEPFTKLIEKVSDAVGGIAKPGQIRRIARAEADADLIRAESKRKISEIEERGLMRMIREEGKRQENIENITIKAAEYLDQNADPDKLDDDWIVNFFDKSKSISNAEMQAYWAKMLAIQANRTSFFSKRTLEIVKSFEISDFNIFNNLCCSFWLMPPFNSLIYSLDAKSLSHLSLNYEQVAHMEMLGLVKIENLSGFIIEGNGNIRVIRYLDKMIIIEVGQDKNAHFSSGKVLLTEAGRELANICQPRFSKDYFDNVMEHWISLGYVFYSPALLNIPQTVRTSEVQ